MRALLFLALTSLIGASGATLRETPARAPETPAPFHIGERLTYPARANFVKAGTATMGIEGLVNIGGHSTDHSVFAVRGRVLFFHVDDHYESWFDPATLISYHHVQHIDESRYQADRVYDFYPERRVYVRNGVENPSVDKPLDEGSFIYFMRSVPLEVGKTYTFNRYYHLDRNPVVITVERREHIKVPAGEFDAIVLKPTIKSKGLFSENGQAEVWLADDSSRTLLRLKSKLPVGTLYLELKQAEYASASAREP